MQRLQAFKYELMPDGQQARQMRGSCRFVFNKALALQKTRYEQGEKKLGYAGLCKLLTEWRNSAETAWLADAPVHPLQQTLKDLERAYSNFFAKRADFPRFKKKGRHDSFRYPDPKQIKLDQTNSRIFLPKLGWLRYRSSREVLGAVKNITVSQSCGKRPSSTKAGPSSAASWTTSWRGTADISSPCRRRTRAGRVRAAVMCRRRTDQHKPDSSV
jgi:putative transposase